jgi:hypothetical protein
VSRLCAYSRRQTTILVATCALGPVEGSISRFEDLGGPEGFVQLTRGDESGTHAEVERTRRAVDLDQAERIEDSLGRGLCLISLDLAEDDGKLVTSLAAGRIVGTTGLAQGRTDGAPHLVARAVASLVVDALESIDVEEKEGQRRSESLV